MKFELKLDMYNAEQEAVWLNDFIREHDVDDLKTRVKEKSPEAGTMDGGILEPTLIGIASGVVTNRIQWLFKKLWQHFDGKVASFEFSAECSKSGKKFSMKFDYNTEEQRDAAEVEFERRYKELCGGKEKKGKKQGEK